MYILGISCFFDDPGAALLYDGRILAIAEEERFVRAKHGVSHLQDKTITNNNEITAIQDIEIRHFPNNSICYCLQKAAIKLNDIDYICVGFDFDALVHQEKKYSMLFENLPRSIVRKKIAAFRNYVVYLDRLAQKAGAKLVFVRHHFAHAFGALMGSGFNDAIALTMDGMGEFESTLISSFHNGKFEVISSIPLPHSLGRMYSSMTSFLGFRANMDEEKVMALAAFGSDNYQREFRKLINPTKMGFSMKDQFFWNADCNMGFKNKSLLQTIFSASRDKTSNPLEGPFKDIARSLQETLFTISNSLVDEAIALTGYHNLCLSGGVALNSVNNGRLAVGNPEIKNVYVQPQANDAGTALGAAYYVYFLLTGKQGEPLRQAYYGACVAEEELKQILASSKLKHTYFEDSKTLGEEVAQKLSTNAIIGWIQGNSEIGPRALGNRSILAQPSPAYMKEKVNAIKGREFWRPFSPTILNEYAGKYLRHKIYCPFMNIALSVTEDGAELLPATIHVDKTSRPQTLVRNVNERFYDLINEYRKLTGTPALLNTSYNVHDEPIVNSAREILIDFVMTDLDALIVGNYFIEK
jgi:carbamoyltransferase